MARRSWSQRQVLHAVLRMTFPAIIFIGLLLLLVFTLRNSAKERNAFFESLNGLLDAHSGEAVRNRFYQLSSLRGHYQGRSVLLSASEGGKNKPPEFRIGMVCRAPTDFEIRVELGGDKFFKALHLMKDVQVGDPSLDDKFIFTCKDTERFTSWVRRAEVRDKLTSMMLDAGVTRLRLTKLTLTAVIVNYKRKHLATPGVECILRNTNALVESLESVFGTASRS